MILLFQTLLNLLFFLIICFFTFYIVGFGLVRIRKNLKEEEVILFSSTLGLVLFVMMAIMLGFLNLRILMLPLILIANALVIYKYKSSVLFDWRIFVRKKFLSVLIILGIIIQGFINFPSGYLYKEGLLFWSSQGHDGLWHVTLMEEISKNFPPKNPIFSGELLYNYHYLVDILMGEFLRVFPVFLTLDLYFRFFPVIFSFLLGLSVFAFVSRWRSSAGTGYWAVFFTYFTGSFGYIITFIRSGNILGGETVFWASQENTLLGNPPHAVAHILLTTFFLSFLLYLKERRFFWIIISFILGALLAGFKVSGGLVLLTGIGAAGLVDALLNKRMKTLLLALSLGISNFVTFKAMTSKEAASFLMFLPWWFIRTMVVDKLGLIDWELKRQHYLSKGTWNANLRVIQLELTAFLIFIIGNFGMRILGVYSLIKDGLQRKLIVSPLDTMLFTSAVTGVLMVVFFVQKGIIYNNIQFIQYSLLIMGFYAAVTVRNMLQYIKYGYIRVLIALVIVILSLPTVLGNLNEFYGPGRTPLAVISNKELEALKLLKLNSNKDDIILTVPFNKYLKDKFPTQPRPIYAWYSTAYVSALTARSTYFTSEEQALITGYPVDKKREKLMKFFKQDDLSFNRKFLADENIKFIYIAKNELEIPLDLEENNLRIFYESDEVVIYERKDIVI